jgi:ribulose-5-phosphate 4-epimerase/fuculose-1-phosphate aldolase
MAMTEGYIKFHCDWAKEEIHIPDPTFLSLENARARLYELGLIGMYPDGIGFGNISIRTEGASFVITGSATGQFPLLDRSHYAIVSAYSFAGNSISCQGQTKASAESLTHAAVYEALPEVGAVVHVHSLQLWKKLLNHYPTTSAEIEYGTPEMAFAVKKLAAEIKDSEEKIIVMGGHCEGILAFGKDLEEATTQILKIYNRSQND